MFDVLFRRFCRENMFGVFDGLMRFVLFYSLLVWKWKDLYNVGSSECHV